MNPVALDRETILRRVNGIQGELKELELKVITENLSDIELFLKAVRTVLQDPQEFGIPV